jgi:hypothetical protein
MDKIVLGIGFGTEKSHNMRLWDTGPKVKKQNPYLLREYPGCGREKLRYRQRLCDDCRRKHRQRTKREYYYKSKRL